MRSIDIHAHLTPQCFWRATEEAATGTPCGASKTPAVGSMPLLAADARSYHRAPAGPLRNVWRTWTPWASTSSGVPLLGIL